MERKTVSARLSENSIWELEFLKSTMGDKKTTEVLTQAIHYFYQYQSQKQQKKNPYEFLKETGFIGAIEGDEKDSINYKKSVTERVKKKL